MQSVMHHPKQSKPLCPPSRPEAPWASKGLGPIQGKIHIVLSQATIEEQELGTIRIGKSHLESNLTVPSDRI